MKLTICTATMQDKFNAGSQYPGEIPSWKAHAVTNPPAWFWKNTAELNWGVTGTYQKLYEDSKQLDFDILAYIHDDVVCREERWDERVLKEFEDPKVGVVGFGGALQHGTTGIYKTPYQLQQLARSSYRSNVDDAEVHGERFTGSCDVAVLDGYALVVRRSLLDRCGSWAWIGRGCDFFCYDYAICALAHRFGYRVRLVGVRCHHLGGQTSVQRKGQVEGIVGQGAYDKAHRWFYEEFRDVLPWGC